MGEKHDQIVDVANPLEYADPAKEKVEAIKVRPPRRAINMMKNMTNGRRSAIVSRIRSGEKKKIADADREFRG